MIREIKEEKAIAIALKEREKADFEREISMLRMKAEKQVDRSAYGSGKQDFQ